MMMGEQERAHFLARCDTLGCSKDLELRPLSCMQGVVFVPLTAELLQLVPEIAHLVEDPRRNVADLGQTGVRSDDRERARILVDRSDEVSHDNGPAMRGDIVEVGSR